MLNRRDLGVLLYDLATARNPKELTASVDQFTEWQTQLLAQAQGDDEVFQFITIATDNFIATYNKKIIEKNKKRANYILRLQEEATYFEINNISELANKISDLKLLLEEENNIIEEDKPEYDNEGKIYSLRQRISSSEEIEKLKEMEVYSTENIKRNLGEFKKSLQTQVSALLESTKNAFDKLILNPIVAWRAKHPKTSPEKPVSQTLKRIKTVFEKPLLATFKKFDAITATSEEINLIINELNAFKSLHKERSFYISNPYPLKKDFSQERYEKEIQYKNPEAQANIYSSYYGDYEIWKEFNANQDIVVQLENTINRLKELRDVKISEENKKEKEINSVYVINNRRDEIISDEEALADERAETYKNEDPFFKIYKLIPGESKDKFEDSAIKNEIRGLYQIFLTQSYTGNETTQERNKIKEKNSALATRLYLILHTILISPRKYLKNEKSPEQIATILASEEMVTEKMKQNIIKGRNIQFDTPKIHEIKTQYPYSFVYQHLRNLLLVCGTNRKDDLKAVLRILDHATEGHENASEQEKLILFEQVVLDAYYFARRTQGHRDSRLADTLEWFIKNKHALDLMRKYKNLKVPHRVKQTDAAPNLLKAVSQAEADKAADSKKLVKIPKRVVLMDSSILTQELIDKLKFEYDEVVLTNLTQTELQDKHTLDLVKKLKNKNLSVRATDLNYSNLITQIRKENSDRDVEFSIFKNQEGLKQLINEEQNRVYLVNENKCYRLKEGFLDVLGDENENKELIDALEKYVTEQTYLASKEDSYNNFFGARTAKQFQKKIDTANTLIKELKEQGKSGKKVLNQGRTFTDEQIDLVRNKKGSLGKIIARGYQHQLPKSFIDDETRRHNKTWFASGKNH